MAIFKKLRGLNTFFQIRVMSENLNLGVNGGGIRPPSQINPQEERIREIVESRKTFQEIYKIAKEKGYRMKVSVDASFIWEYKLTLEKGKIKIVMQYSVYPSFRDAELVHLVCYNGEYRYAWLRNGEFMMYRLGLDGEAEKIVLVMKVRKQNLEKLALEIVDSEGFSYLEFSKNKFSVI